MPRFLFISLTLLMLSACTVTETSFATVQVSRTNQAERQIPILTMVPTKTASPTVTTIMTNEAGDTPPSLPAVTTFISPTPSSAALTATPTAVPTQTSSSLLRPTVPPGYKESEFWTDVSPDGRWTAYGQWLFEINGDDQLVAYRMLLILENDEQTIRWQIIDEQEDVGMGYSIPVIFQWAKSGQYAYVTHLDRPDGGGDCLDFINGSDLLQVDLETGQVTELVPYGHYALSFSADETMVAAMAPYQQAGLYIYNLSTKQVSHLPFDLIYGSAGSMVWSPDNQQLLFSQTSGSVPGDEFCRAYDLILVDIADLTLTPLLENDERRFVPVVWEANDLVTLQDDEGNLWQYSLADNTLTSVTAP